MATLPLDAFHVSKENLSTNVNDMVSTSCMPKLWSPGVGNFCVPDADIFVARNLFYNKIAHGWDKLFLGRVAHAKHHM